MGFRVLVSWTVAACFTHPGGFGIWSSGWFGCRGTLVASYLANFAGSTGRERELALIKNMAEEHCNCSEDLLAALHEIRLDGPETEATLCTRFSSDLQHACLAPSSLGRKLASRWVEVHGRRFRLYRVRKDKGVKRGHRAGSEAALVSSQRRGRARLSAGEGVCKNLLGMSREALLVPANQRREKYRLSVSENHGESQQRKGSQKHKFAVGPGSIPIGSNESGASFFRLLGRGLAHNPSPFPREAPLRVQFVQRHSSGFSWHKSDGQVESQDLRGRCRCLD